MQQWWRAALGDSGDRFPWGSDLRIDARSNFSMASASAVGAYAFGMSPYGLHDTAGNISEWTGGGSADRFVVLGGSWQDPTYVFDTPAVESYEPWLSSEALGFRLVKAVP